MFSCIKNVVLLQKILEIGPICILDFEQDRNNNKYCHIRYRTEKDFVYNYNNLEHNNLLQILLCVK